MIAADLDSLDHHVWLARESDRLIDFFTHDVTHETTLFQWRDARGIPDASRPEYLYAVARLVHCFSVEHILGRPEAGRWAQAGVDRLLARFLDPIDGGFFASVNRYGSIDSARKETYGQAFALLAGTSARAAGIPGGARLFAEARKAIDERMWDEQAGVAVESYARDWSSPEDYRGQNCNMHLVEAFLAAYELTGEEVFAQRAERIAERLVLRGASESDWRIPEHYTVGWEVDREYGIGHPNDPFRPFGTLIGHSFEWSRLLLQLNALRPGAVWARDAAQRLFERAVADGWDDQRGGLAYSVDRDGNQINRARMHWTIAEAIGAAFWLYRATGNQDFRDWYSTFWSYADRHVLDRQGGSWWHELDAGNHPAATTWDGKPDLYHAWQATLYARVTSDAGLATAALRGDILCTGRNSEPAHEGAAQ